MNPQLWWYVARASGLATLFVALHIAGLVADAYVHFGLAELLVPKERRSALREGTIGPGRQGSIRVTLGACGFSSWKTTTPSPSLW